MVWGAYRAKAEYAAGRLIFSSWSVRRKLLFSLIPSVLLVLFVTGYATNRIAARYLTQALERTTQTQNLAQVREIEGVLEYFRVAALELAEGQRDRDDLEAAFRRHERQHPGYVKEIAYLSLNPKETRLYLGRASGLAEVPADQRSFIKNSPLTPPGPLLGSTRGVVQLSNLVEAVYPASQQGTVHQASSISVLRLVTPVFDATQTLRGHLILGISALELRNVLSLYNSPKSPLYAFPRTSELRFSFLFDDQGWILLESETMEELEKPLSVEDSRSGMMGDFGTPLYERAFRPSPKNENYWKMVVSVQAGQHGLAEGALMQDSELFSTGQQIVAYAPLRFRSNPGKPPVVWGGVAYADKTRLTDVAEFRHLDVMTIIALGAMVLIAALISVLASLITRPMLRLSAEISQLLKSGELRTLDIQDLDRETSSLKNALNELMIAVIEQKEQIRIRDEHIHHVRQRQSVSFDEHVPASVGWRLVGEIPDLVGQSAPMQQLQSSILKAAQSDADVLIVGETGTGKELTAEAVHKFSTRSGMPFISINCGGLDENLLLDTLFGHVKGAFSEAHGDRKGAFLASDGGTLFLDEIGTASDKVQKALLRALSVRRVRPLGSDLEIEFNVRVIAATNVDLLELVQLGKFRDDLYYRLKVITIQTPPLRQRKDDIPLLANTFLKEASVLANRQGVSLSRGALEKLMNHEWPGNVRELKNCITRAVTFTERDVIFTEDLEFDGHVISPDWTGRGAALPAAMFGGLDALPTDSGQGPAPQGAGGAGWTRTEAGQPPARPEAGPELTARQRQALELARAGASFSRTDFQQKVGGGLSLRMAQYDLQDLVKKGLLVKEGRGPATRYRLAQPSER